jgi:hypothetical protein
VIRVGKSLKHLILLEVRLLDARRRRLAPKVVVSSGKFVRVVILPLHGKDRLSGKGGKWLKDTRLVVGSFSYKLLNGDVAFS